MANVRELKEHTWDNLDKFLEHQSKLSHSMPQIHFRIPLCIGYKESVGPEDLQALMAGVAAREDCKFTIYLSPKDEAALENWKKLNAEVYEANKANIVLISDWRKEKVWADAAKSFSKYSLGDKKATVERMESLDAETFHKHQLPDPGKAAEAKTQEPVENDNVSHILKDIEAYNGRHVEATPQQIIDHVIEEVKDVLSWMEKKDPATQANKTISDLSVLLYPRSLTQTMRNALQNADAIGYKEQSLLHIRFGTRPAKNQAAQADVVEKVALAYANQRIEPKYAAEVIHNLHQLQHQQGHGTTATIMNGLGQAAPTNSRAKDQDKDHKVTPPEERRQRKSPSIESNHEYAADSVQSNGVRYGKAM